MKQAKAKKSQFPNLAPEKVFNLFLPILLLLVIAHLLSTYWQTPSLWGIHHLYFFPRWLGWILTIMIISLFVPPVNSFVLKFLESIFAALERIFVKLKKYPLFAIAGLLSIPLFWSLRTKLFLLGDGYLKIEILPGDVITPTEWLDEIIHRQFYRLLVNISPDIDPSFSYTILSLVCGGIFVFLILTISDLLGKSNFQKVMIFSALFTLGSIELFFGYVESYAILLTGLTCFILFSILYIQGRGSIIFAFLALVLSIALHVSAIIFIFSFLYIIFWRWKKQKNKLPDIFTLFSIVGCLGIIFWAIWKVFLLEGEGNRFGQFLPLLSSAKDDFTMFCGAHIGEFINQHILISPVGIMLFLFFLFYTLKFKSFKDPVLNFLLISSLSGLFLVFIYNCHWGNADWDLRSSPGIFFTLFGILQLIKWGSGWTKFKNYGLILIAISVFHTVPWILVNADEQMSLDRYLMTATSDRHILSDRGCGMWRVGRALQMAGFPEKAKEVFEEGIKRNPEDMGCYPRLVKILYDQGKYNQAEFYLKRAIRLKPDRSDIRYSLGQVYLKKKNFQEAIFHLEKIKEEYESDSAFVINLSKAYLKTKRPEEAKNLLLEFLEKNQESATIRGLLGVSFFMLEDFSNAKNQWERALKLDPDEPHAKTGLEGLSKIIEK